MRKPPLDNSWFTHKWGNKNTATNTFIVNILIIANVLQTIYLMWLVSINNTNHQNSKNFFPPHFPFIGVSIFWCRNSQERTTISLSIHVFGTFASSNVLPSLENLPRLKVHVLGTFVSFKCLHHWGTFALFNCFHP